MSTIRPATADDWISHRATPIEEEELGELKKEKVFCPTGPGGGVDATCKPGGRSSGGTGRALSDEKDTQAFLAKSVESVNAWLKSPEAKKEWEEAYPKEAFDIDAFKGFTVLPNGRFWSNDSDRSTNWKAQRAVLLKTSKDVADGMDISDNDAAEFAKINNTSTVTSVKGLVRYLISDWNYDSQSPASIAIQQAAASLMKTEGARSTGTSAFLSNPVNKKVIEDFVSSVYTNTQKQMTEAGLEKMVVYRGVNGVEGDMKYEAGELDSIKMNPISSFSTSVQQAEKFSQNDDIFRGLVVGGVVPKERVFSLSTTGLGTFSEAEAVVAHSDTDKMLVRSHKFTFTENEEGGLDFNTRYKTSDDFWN